MHFQIGFAIVDAGYSKAPAQERDAFWSTTCEDPLYSEEAASKPINPQIGSVANVEYVFYLLQTLQTSPKSGADHDGASQDQRRRRMFDWGG